MTMIPAMLFAFSSAALSGLAALATVAGVVVLLRGLGDLRGTTLFAPWSWLLASVMAIGSVQVVAALSPAGASRDWFDALRYVAAVTTFCPMVAVLGAKRPQNRAWMFIVLTLLGVLALPALTALAVGRGDGIETHLARQWFAVALIVVAPLNYLLTRYAPATLVFAAAQVFLLAEHLPGGQSLVFTGSQAVGPILMLLAICLAVAHGGRRDAAKSFGRLWTDFRTMYGSLWSLRVVERLNAEADSHDWPVRFSWIGMVRSDGDLARDRDVRQNDRRRRVDGAGGAVAIRLALVDRRALGGGCRGDGRRCSVGRGWKIEWA
ncbi:MAG: hypothetical protein IIA67_11510 [Planctomycetes bacterium]|nr:hypothetical protein [Planctomycetota bacterium]